MDKILAAAESVFAEQGYDGARTRDIAARAGVNVSTLHYHYKSKEDLHAAVLAAVIHEVRDRIIAAADEAVGHVSTRVRHLVEAHFDAIAARPHFPRLLMDALIHAPERLREISQAAAFPLMEAILRALGTEWREAMRWDVDPRQALLSAHAMNMIYFVAAPLVEGLFGEDCMSPEKLQARKSHVVDLLLNGLLSKEARK